MATAFVLCSSGDIIYQLFFEKGYHKQAQIEALKLGEIQDDNLKGPWKWDKLQTVRSGVSMGFVINPSTQMYYHFINPHMKLSAIFASKYLNPLNKGA